MPAVKANPNRKKEVKTPSSSGRVIKRTTKKSVKKEAVISEDTVPLTPGWHAGDSGLITQKTPSPFQNRRMTRRSSMYVAAASMNSNVRRATIVPMNSPPKRRATRSRQKIVEDLPASKLPVKKTTPEESRKPINRKYNRVPTQTKVPARPRQLKSPPATAAVPVIEDVSMSAFKTPTLIIRRCDKKRQSIQRSADLAEREMVTSTPIAPVKAVIPPFSEIRRVKNVSAPVTLDSTAFLRNDEVQDESAQAENPSSSQWTCNIM